MRKMLMMTALCLVGALAFAPAALAQGVGPGGGTGPYGCPEDMPFVAAAPGDPGEGSLLCFASQEEADVYSSTGENTSADASSTASASASASAGQSCEEVQAILNGEAPGIEDLTPEQLLACGLSPEAIDPCEGNPDPAACRAETGTSSSEFPSINVPDTSANAEGNEGDSATASASASAGTATVALPETGGASVLALGAGVLLLIGGLAARRIVR